MNHLSFSYWFLVVIIILPCTLTFCNDEGWIASITNRSKYAWQNLTAIEGDNNIIIVGDFNIPLTSMDRPSRHKINKASHECAWDYAESIMGAYNAQPFINHYLRWCQLDFKQCTMCLDLQTFCLLVAQWNDNNEYSYNFKVLEDVLVYLVSHLTLILALLLLFQLYWWDWYSITVYPGSHSVEGYGDCSHLYLISLLSTASCPWGHSAA